MLALHPGRLRLKKLENELPLMPIDIKVWGSEKHLDNQQDHVRVLMKRSIKMTTASFVMRCSLYVFFIIIGSIAATRAFAAPITFNTALPVAEGEGIFRIQSRYIRSTDDPTTQDRELTVWSAPIVLVYGVNRDITLFGIIPYLDKELELTTSSGRLRRGDTGLGDTTFVGRYTIWKLDQLGQTTRIAPFAAIKAPTGEDSEEDGLGRLPQTLQLGSGSWDYTLGTIMTWQTFDWQFDGSASYRFNKEANNFRFGDQARLDLSYQYRLLPRRLGPGVPNFLYVVAESTLIWQGKNEIGEVDDKDSGGTTWFLTPGIQYVTKRFILESALQLPVLQDLNGDALANDFAGILSFRTNF